MAWQAATWTMPNVNVWLLWNRMLRKQRNEQAARRSQPAPTASQADANPVGTLGGGAAGQAAGILLRAIARNLGHGQEHREEVRRGGRSGPPRNSAPRSVPRPRPWPHS